MGKQKNVFRRRTAGVMLLVMTAVMLLGNIPFIPVRVEGGAYPYMIFAASGEEGAVTLSANNAGLNGSVATNGSIAVFGDNCNINGARTERGAADANNGGAAGETGETLLMPDLRER